MKLECVGQVLDPFGDRDLPRVEHDAGEGVELPPAVLALAECQADLLGAPVLPDPHRAAIRAAGHLD